MAELILGFLGYKTEENTQQPSFIFSHNIEMEKPGSIDILLKVSGQRSFILDTVQRIPKNFS
jgi:hypothetical protein